MLPDVTGAEIRTWREARGLSQPQLARLLGVDTMTVWRWEKGQRNPPAGVILDRALRDIDRERAEQPPGAG